MVGSAIVSVLWNKLVNHTLLESQLTEILWTTFPAIILLFIAIPSVRLLYLIDEVNTPRLTFKVLGHQWYWSYEYSDLGQVEFDSYLLPLASLPLPGFRNLDVDSRAVIPLNTQIRALVTASDVIHSWAVPSLGVKVDAIPGRLNQLRFIRLRPGLLYGQCSEICGANHRFIPIVLERVPLASFLNWVKP